MRLKLWAVVSILLVSGLPIAPLAADRPDAEKSVVKTTKAPLAPKNNPPLTQPKVEMVAPPPTVTTVKHAPPRPIMDVAPRPAPRPTTNFAPPPKRKPPRRRNLSYDMLVSEDGLTLHAIGEIKTGFTYKFKKAIEENPTVKTVILSSPGGVVIEGIAVAKLIEEHGLNTHVEVVCASACTFAFLKGKRKTISKSGGLGFHQAHKGFVRRPVDTSLAGRNASSWAMAYAYRDAGLDDDAVEQALSTGPKDMWFPDNDALVKSLKNAKAVGDGTMAFATKSWKSSSNFRNLLAADSIWRTMADTDRTKYLNATSKIWIDAILKDDRDKAVESVQGALIEILFADLAKYPDDIIETALQLQNDIWQLKDDTRNKKCASIGNRRVPSLNATIFDHKERQNALLKEIMAYKIDDEPLSDEEKNRSYALAIDFWGLMLSKSKTRYFGGPYAFCSKPKRYFEQLVKLPKEERIATYRALMTPEAEYKPLSNRY